jgi:hypothetical protein
MGDSTYNSKNYMKQGGDEWVIGGKATFESGSEIEMAGTDITNDIAHLAGLPVGASFTIGEEDSGAITVNVQIEDASGAAQAAATALWCYLSDEADGVGVTATAPSGGVATGTDGTILAEVTADSLWLVETEADGDLDLVLTEAGAATWYLVLIMPDGRKVVSGAITFA